MGKGPLQGIRVLELAGLGPVMFCGMLLADLGADVVVIDRPTGRMRIVSPEFELLNRGKRSISLDLKRPPDVEIALDLCQHADILIEGFRPGVAEKLGIGPEACFRRNPILIFGRATGWGQDGPLAHTPGHDLTYIALSGALHTIGPAGGPPQVPLALVGDFPTGLYLTVGLLSALYEARISGRGQVIDAAVVDGAAHLLTMFYGFLAAGKWEDQRGVNLVDGGAPFYHVHSTKDGKYMAVGAMEPQFFDELMRLLDIDDGEYVDHFDPAVWPILREKISKAFNEKTQDEWITIFEGTDACVAPVIDLRGAPKHPHLSTRETFVEINGVTQPAPTPRFSRTSTFLNQGPCQPGQDAESIINDWLDK